MYLKEIGFISQSVVLDTRPYKSVPGSNRTEGTFEEALANPGIHNPDRTSHHLGNHYTGATQCRDNRRVILSFSKIRSLHHRSSNAIHNDVSLFGMGYMTQGPLPAKPNNVRNI